MEVALRFKFCHCEGVNATMSLQSSTAGSAESLTRETVDVLVKCSHSFLDWQRACIFQGTPDSEMMERHRQALKWLLRLVSVLLAQAEDPEYPDSRAAGELRAVKWKLSESWESIHNPIQEAEYKNLVAELFPGHESRA
jgi:hypothetical protein